MIAKFSHWVPKDLDKPRAIIVLTPPSQSDGRDEVNNSEWQAFAIEHSVALVGCFFQDDVPGGIEDYCDVHTSDGYGDPMSQAGNDLQSYLRTNFTPYPSKECPPVLLYGFSAGGQFNYEFTCSVDSRGGKYDVKVAGFVVNKGGIYYTALAPKATRDIPSLWFLGTRDDRQRQSIIRGIFELNTRAGAKNWVLIEENTSHSVGDSKHLSMEFFKQILKKL